MSTIRNSGLQELAAMLREEQAAKLDVVAPAASLAALDNGILSIEGAGSKLDDEGVSPAPAFFQPTEVAQEGLAAKLSIPSGYLKRMASEKPKLWADNVNEWLGDDPARRFMLRTFRGGGNDGVLRAFLSDSYLTIDHFDALIAVLAGIRESGHPVQVTSTDLTDRRMVVKVNSDAVAQEAPRLLAGYRSPFNGKSADDLPVISAGFVISNSETGNGAFQIVPRLTVQVCTNGMTITKDAMRSVHLGAKVEAGVVRASTETMERQLALISSRTTDAVKAFLSGAYLDRTIRAMETQAGHPVTDPVKTIEIVSRSLSLSKEQQGQVLDHFIRGGQLTAGGVMQAVTSAAQEQADADAAFDMEAQALAALTSASNIRI